MKSNNQFDVLIIGGSYAGLAAGMALGRARKNVLIIDDGKPCNRQTPHSHNLVTHDGETPAAIAALARKQVLMYPTVTWLNARAFSGQKTNNGFEIWVASGEAVEAKKIIFATGIRDILPAIDGLAACWGISVLHCPYCHGYEVKNEATGILGNGEAGFDLARLISNWTNDLTLYTNGMMTLSPLQIQQLNRREIKIEGNEIEKLEHVNGQLQYIAFKDGSVSPLKALYIQGHFEQHCSIPLSLGCNITDEGYIKVDAFQETTIDGVFACGDNTSRMRTLANAIAMGTATGIAVSKKMILEEF